MSKFAKLWPNLNRPGHTRAAGTNTGRSSIKEFHREPIAPIVNGHMTPTDAHAQHNVYECAPRPVLYSGAARLRTHSRRTHAAAAATVLGVACCARDTQRSRIFVDDKCFVIDFCLMTNNNKICSTERFVNSTVGPINQNSD